MPAALPIDELLPEIAGHLRAGPALVIEAPPGAGKTTRVPPLLLGLHDQGEVLVLEPRRLAAHLSAARVAEEHGWRLGDEVGVQMRFDSICGPHTRLRFVTEGVLVRRLLSDPELAGVRAVVLDEFHERHLQADISLALLRRLQRGPRPDLRLCVMSATLESARVADFLGGCPVVRSEGRLHEVEVRYLQAPAERPLHQEVRSALFRLLQEEAQAGDGAGGDVLVFLPGAAEIRRTREELAELARQRGLQVLPLHGDMPLAEQRRAVLPRAPGAGRKVILSTNVAETSVTIDGVSVVIDSGLVRVAGHSPWSGLPTLKVQRTSRAAAAQRAGRSGRTRPGRCLRLYTRHDHDTRQEYEVPEVRRIDLAETVLLLRAAGLSADRLEWLEPPDPSALLAAEALLVRLGALAGAEPRSLAITPRGRRMALLPVHPRQARVVLGGQERGAGEEACTVAAILGERDLRLQQRAGGAGATEFRPAREESGPSDVLLLCDLYEEARRLRFDPGRLPGQGIDPFAAQAVDRVRRHLCRLLPGGTGRLATEEAREEALLLSILDGYPDRVARRRGRGAARGAEQEVVLAGGGTAVLATTSVVRDAELMVLIDAEVRSGPGAGGPGGKNEGRGQVLVRLASAIQADWLLELPALRETSEALWNPAAERVEVVRRLQYDQLVLDESRAGGDGGDPAQAGILAEAALAAGPAAFADRDEIDRLLCRIGFLAAHFPDAGWPVLGPQEVEAALAGLCAGRSSFAEVREASLLGAVRARHGLDTAEKARALARLAPEQITLPGGRRVRVEYAQDRPPWIASRLQDFFGLLAGPAIAGGKVPLVLHLLAPNQRPVQVTTDLAGFWSRHYPAIRKELGRRYPRHPWPEDPRAALPPHRGQRGQR